jgi:hypothetical protein
MNKIIEKQDILSEQQWAELSLSISEYNEYFMQQLNKIFEFDIWFEHSKSKDFPKEWYSMIRESKAHK